MTPVAAARSTSTSTSGSGSGSTGTGGSGSGSGSGRNERCHTLEDASDGIINGGLGDVLGGNAGGDLCGVHVRGAGHLLVESLQSQASSQNGPRHRKQWQLVCGLTAMMLVLCVAPQSDITQPSKPRSFFKLPNVSGFSHDQAPLILL